jgi:hypothetical protein
MSQGKPSHRGSRCKGEGWLKVESALPVHPELRDWRDVVDPGAPSPRLTRVWQVSSVGDGRYLIVIGRRSWCEVLHSVTVDENDEELVLSARVAPVVGRSRSPFSLGVGSAWVTEVHLHRPLGDRTVFSVA